MNIFDVVIVQPIFNLLMLIYGLIPDFGVSIIIFTIIIRFLLWPLIKKQLHQAKAMRKMQPELAKIKTKHKNNKQAQGMAMMELYKEHGISPFGSIGNLLIQLPILIGMYRVVQIFVSERTELAKYTYGFMENLPIVNNLVHNPDQFNQYFLGFIDLTKHAVSDGGVVVSLLILVLLASVLQYFISKQMSPNSDSNRRLRDILAEAGEGKEADQTEINAVMMRKMMKFMPIMLFFIMINLPGALALYMLTSNGVAYLQNKIILGKDKEELQQIASQKPSTASTAKAAKPSAEKRAKKATEARITKIKAKD